MVGLLKYCFVVVVVVVVVVLSSGFRNKLEKQIVLLLFHKTKFNGLPL